MALDRDDILERLRQAEGPRADLSGLDLSGADLSRLDLRGVDLSRADLSAADLRWAVLEGADLHSSVLRKADVRWAVLRGAVLKQADLGRANLGWADLAGADLRGAALDGAALESAELAGALLDRAEVSAGLRPAMATAGAPAMLPGLGGQGAGAWSRGIARGGAVAGRLAIPQVSVRSIVLGLLGVLLALQVWGWRFRSSYLLDGFQLRGQLPLDRERALVGLGQAANLGAGFTEVLPFVLKLALGLPFALLGLLGVLALIALPLLLLWRLGERALGDLLRPRWRPVVVLGLFVSYTALFVLVLFPAGLELSRWAMARGLPGTGALGLLRGLLVGGPLWQRLGLLAALAGTAWPLSLLLRHLAQGLRTWEPPLAWRLRYPLLNSASSQWRRAGFLARARPVEAAERRRGLQVSAGLALVLVTLLAGAGRVQAEADACDGGDLPRILLYVGDREPEQGPVCQRLLAETEEHYYTFFPSQTSQGEGANAVHLANVREIAKERQLTMIPLAADDPRCPTCLEGSDGSEVAVVDPDEQTAQGPIAAVAGRVVTLDVPPGEGVFDSIVVSDGTEVTVDGRPASIEDLQPGKRVVAFGRADPASPTKLNARQLSVVVARGQDVPEPGTVEVDLSNPRTPIFMGSGWPEGGRLEVRLVNQAQLADEGKKGFDARGLGHLLSTVQVPPGGSFSSPYILPSEVPTGPDQRILVIDPATGSYQKSSTWLQEPLPPPSATPTERPVAPTYEATVTPTGEGAGAETPSPSPAAEASNTPLPTPLNAPPGSAGSGAGADCDDAFEPDNRRGQEREVYASLGGDGKAETRKSCYKGDIDLVAFEVKGGRWYKVSTTELAPGVDTLIAVGDLPEGSTCLSVHPDFGCWNDDKDGNALESEIFFRAGGNGRVLVTVDNRGTRFGAEASYGLAVAQTVLEPSATPSAAPTLTPAPTRTRLPRRDDYDNAAANNSCRYATVLKWASPWEDDLLATIASASDQDWYQIELTPFNTSSGPGYYRIEMTPPDDRDYDMDVGPFGGTGVCSNENWVKHRDGDRRESVDIRADSKKTLWIQVYGRPGANEFDPYEYYSVSIRYAPGSTPVGGGSGGSQTPPTATQPPPPTSVPPQASVTPTPPGRSVP